MSNDLTSRKVLIDSMDTTGKKTDDYKHCKECKNYMSLPNGLRGGKRGYCKRRNIDDIRRGNQKACKLFVDNMERSSRNR